MALGATHPLDFFHEWLQTCGGPRLKGWGGGGLLNDKWAVHVGSIRAEFLNGDALGPWLGLA